MESLCCTVFRDMVKGSEHGVFVLHSFQGHGKRILAWSLCVAQFSGTWYSAGESAADGLLDDHPVGSATYHFAPKDDGTVTMLYSAVG